jgi:uncharacterized lipoprotein
MKLVLALAALISILSACSSTPTAAQQEFINFQAMCRADPMLQECRDYYDQNHGG